MYKSIPKQLYREVKKYLVDHLKNEWIITSYLTFANPMVCVHKRDVSLRLCIDYCDHNSKTIPDIMPLPKLNEIINSLVGKSWFSTLDIFKTYHQGFADE